GRGAARSGDRRRSRGADGARGRGGERWFRHVRARRTAARGAGPGKRRVRARGSVRLRGGGKFRERSCGGVLEEEGTVEIMGVLFAGAPPSSYRLSFSSATRSFSACSRYWMRALLATVSTRIKASPLSHLRAISIFFVSSACFSSLPWSCVVRELARSAA